MQSSYELRAPNLKLDEPRSDIKRWWSETLHAFTQYTIPMSAYHLLRMQQFLNEAVREEDTHLSILKPKKPTPLPIMHNPYQNLNQKNVLAKVIQLLAAKTTSRLDSKIAMEKRERKTHEPKTPTYLNILHVKQTSKCKGRRQETRHKTHKTRRTFPPPHPSVPNKFISSITIIHRTRHKKPH